MPNVRRASPPRVLLFLAGNPVRVLEDLLDAEETVRPCSKVASDSSAATEVAIVGALRMSPKSLRCDRGMRRLSLVHELGRNGLLRDLLNEAKIESPESCPTGCCSI